MTVNEKDRLGDKLREAERGREDQYFAERDRKLVEEIKKAKATVADAKVKDAVLGRCPKCGAELQARSLHEIKLDECPSCHGVWLEAGELQELARREDEGWIARWLRLEFQKQT